MFGPHVPPPGPQGNNDEMEGGKVEDIIRMDDEVVALQFLRVGSIKGLPLDQLTNCRALSLHRNLLHKCGWPGSGRCEPFLFCESIGHICKLRFCICGICLLS